MSLNFSIGRAEMADRERFMVKEDVPDLGKYREGKRQASARESELHQLFFLLSLHNFGVEPTISQRAVLDMACRLGMEFFAGDWWTHHKSDTTQLSRDDENPELKWFKPFRLSLLFAALRRDESLLRILGKWPRDWMSAEWRATPFPDGIEQFYFAMMTRLGIGELATDPGKIDDERIALLFRAMEDPADEGLADSLNETLSLFVSELSGKKVLPYEAIAIEETIIVFLWKLLRNVDMTPRIETDLRAVVLDLQERTDRQP